MKGLDLAHPYLFFLNLKPFSESVTLSVNKPMTKRRELNRSRQNRAWMKWVNVELDFEGTQKCESVQGEQGGDIPGRENGMCKGEARKQRGGRQISRLKNEVGKGWREPGEEVGKGRVEGAVPRAEQLAGKMGEERGWG